VELHCRCSVSSQRACSHRSSRAAVQFSSLAVSVNELEATLPRRRHRRAAISDSAIRPSVRLSQPRLWARWLPAAGRPPEMCRLRTRPRTDVDPPRVELPSAGDISSRRSSGAIPCLPLDAWQCDSWCVCVCVCVCVRRQRIWPTAAQTLERARCVQRNEDSCVPCCGAHHVAIWLPSLARPAAPLTGQTDGRTDARSLRRPCSAYQGRRL